MFASQTILLFKFNCINMNTQSFLDSLESKAYRSFYKDGLMDLFFGLLLIGVGLNVLRLRMGIDTSKYITCAVLLLIPAFILARRFITLRRLGYASFGGMRKKRKALALLVAVIAQLLFGFLLWTSFEARTDPDVIPLHKFINPYTQFVFITLVFSLIGYLIDYNRFYIIGFAVGTGLFLSHSFNNSNISILMVYLSFGLAGIFLTISGIIMLVRFLHKYPNPGQSDKYEKKQ
jgi:hypothetical protein